MGSNLFWQRVTNSLLRPRESVAPAQAVKSGGGRYFVKLCLLISLIELLLMLCTGYLFGGLDRSLDAFLSAAPDFSITDGTMSVTPNTRHVFALDTLVIVFDTTGGAIDPADFSEYDANLLLLGRTEFTYVTAFQSQSFSYSSFELSLSRDSLARGIRHWAWTGYLLACALSFVVHFISGIVYSLIVALIAASFNVLFIKAKIPFGKVYALSLFALTAVYLIELLCYAISNTGLAVLQLPWLFSYAITLIYMSLYLNEIAKEQRARGMATAGDADGQEPPDEPEPPERFL